MDITIRRAKVGDAARCAEIFYEAFVEIAQRHNFPPDVTPPDTSPDSPWTARFSRSDYYVVVAEIDGELVGSNMLDERDPIAGVGPITVDPKLQEKMVGRLLMEDVLERCRKREVPGVRLVQGAFNRTSMALYTKLGFEIREFLVSISGPPIGATLPGYSVRAALREDLELCNQLCEKVHGIQRSGSLGEAIDKGTALVVERDSRLTGYVSAMASGGHAVGETTDDLKALISSAPENADPGGFIIPARNGELFRWCLEQGFRILTPLTLMSKGFYQEPTAAFFPSIFY